MRFPTLNLSIHLKEPPRIEGVCLPFLFLYPYLIAPSLCCSIELRKEKEDVQLQNERVVVSLAVIDLRLLSGTLGLLSEVIE